MFKYANSPDSNNGLLIQMTKYCYSNAACLFCQCNLCQELLYEGKASWYNFYMLYILGGTARSGKTLIARKIAKNKGIPYFSTDLLISSLQRGAPELGIKHGQKHISKAKKLWKFAEPLMKSFIKNTDGYLFEGDGLLPLQVNKILKEYPDKAKSCFVGFTEIKRKDKLVLIRKYEYLPNEWTSKHSDKKVLAMVDNMVDISKYLKSECKKYSINFIEVGQDLLVVEKKVMDVFFN